MKARIGLLIVATLVALASCEIAARMVFPAPPNPARQPQIKYRYDPEIRYIPLPNQYGWIDDGFVTTNSQGFRGADPATPKPKGMFRIVAVGDSVTFGFGVNDADTFCTVTEHLLRKKMSANVLEVVNIAVPGFDTRQEVGLLRRYVERLQPNLVLVGMYSNDVPDSLEDKESGTTVATGNPEAGRILQMNAAPTSWWSIQLRKSRATYTIGRALKRLTHQGEWGMSRFSMELDMLEGRATSQLDEAWGKVTTQLKDLRVLANQHAFDVAIVVLPPREQVLGLYPTAQYQSKVRAIAEPLGFRVIDPLPALTGSSGKKDELYIAYDRNHPSKDGHRLIAEAIADDLGRAHFEFRKDGGQ